MSYGFRRNTHDPLTGEPRAELGTPEMEAVFQRHGGVVHMLDSADILTLEQLQQECHCYDEDHPSDGPISNNILLDLVKSIEFGFVEVLPLSAKPRLRTYRICRDVLRSRQISPKDIPHYAPLIRHFAEINQEERDSQIRADFIWFINPEDVSEKA